MSKTVSILTVIATYSSLTLFNAIGQYYFKVATAFIMPLLLLIAPMIIQRTINLRLSIKDALLGLLVSLFVLSLFVAILAAFRGSLVFTMPNIKFIVITFFAVALPEEAFFRGFLLPQIGCNCKGVFISSLLFAIAHNPKFFYFGDYLTFATFFPSLVMGYLYVKTTNILPCIIFHGLSNLTMFMVMQIY